MRYRAFFNTHAIAYAFFMMVCKKKHYNKRRITGIGCGGGTKYQSGGGFTWMVTWDTE